MKAAILFVLLILCHSSAIADWKYTFVRIEGLAEQKIAESLLTHIYKKIGFDVRIIALPGKRANCKVISGDADGETARIYSYGENNPELIRVPTPYGRLETTAFALKKNNIVIKSKDDLKNYKVVILRGVQHTADITKNLEHVEIINDIDSMMQFIKSERADIALTNTLSGIGALKKLKIKNIEISGTIEELELYHYLISKNKNISAKVDETIREMTTSGELSELTEQYERQYLESIK